MAVVVNRKKKDKDKLLILGCRVEAYSENSFSDTAGQFRMTFFIIYE
jgi:hypothetical protein